MNRIGYTANPSQQCVWCGESTDSYVIYNRRAICERCVLEDQERSRPEQMLGAVMLGLLIAVVSVIAWIVKG